MNRSLYAHRERGQSLVEFALAIPVIFMLVFGLLNIGRAVQSYVALSGAVRDGARYATLFYDANKTPPSQTDVETYVKNAASSPIMSANGINVIISGYSTTQRDPSSMVTITATYSFNLAGPFLPNQTLQLVAVTSRGYE